MNVRLTPEQKIKLLNSKDVYSVMQQILLRENKIRRGQEHLWVIGLNSRNKILFIELVALGATNWVATTAPDLFRVAIYKLAVNIIIVHNHPSGECTPTEADIAFTTKMATAAKLLDIHVLDHLVITESEYCSLADKGKMPDLLQGVPYEVVPTEEAELRKLKIDKEKQAAAEKAKKAGEKKGQKEKALEMAVRLKAEGMDDMFIQRVTGLTEEDIKKL